ncbi:MAG: hypothetical protein MRY79_06675 [Alphaproteobacteria bacterium]|nr:hypothetical protein [Alphaproteobacteria bacterium]
MSACAGLAPVPGGSDTVNRSFYESENDLKTRIQDLKVGMTKEQVFARLNRQEEHFILLSRKEIMSALNGGTSQVAHTPNYPPSYGYSPYGYNYYARYNNPANNLQAFSGHKLIFKNVERAHGISSPIAMRTDESGFSYTATFIFYNNYLYEKPVLSGGAIDARSTKTIFDYLSPSNVIGRIPI